MIARLSIYSQTKGIALMPFGFYRTAAQQIINRIKGTSSVKRSFHQDWLAIDFVIIKEGAAQWERSAEYEDLGLYWESMGGIWGGRWNTINDIYHFQYGDPFENPSLISRFLESFTIRDWP